MSDAERLKRYKSGLAGLRRGRRFIRWSQSHEFAAHLESLLDELRASDCDARTGADLTGKFFECDDSVLGRCDDSSGIIGDVFRETARNLWVGFASRCEDKEWILDRVFALVAIDSYGVRTCVLEAAPEYLTESEMRSLADRLWVEGEKTVGQKDRNSWYLLVGIVARCLKDPALYERATVAWCGGDVGGLALRIAAVYLDAGSPTGALRWLESRREWLREDERDRLLLQAYEQLGSKSKQLEVARRIFEQSPSPQDLDRLVAVAGEDRRVEFVEEVVTRVKSGPLDLVCAEFLLDVGHEHAVDRHIVARRADLDGNNYPVLLSVAHRLESGGLLLSTTCLYRALVDSILMRARSKNYSHAVRYLKKLDNLALRVRDWGPVESHIAYRTQLAEQHRLKRSFWRRVSVTADHVGGDAS